MIYHRLLVILVASFMTQIVSGQNKSSIPDTLINRVKDSFTKDKKAVGLSIGVYNNGASTFYNFGSINKSKTKEPTQNTVYEIGSVTKSFVSLILAHAVIEKKVMLTDDIRLYLDGNYPNLEYNKTPITLAQLANTTSGIPNWVPATPKEITNAPSDSSAFLRNKIYSTYTRKNFYDALHQIQLDTVPGFKTRHSNAAAQLLSYILERVYKTSIEKLVEKYILVPNKMFHTSFIASKSNVRNLAVGYNEKGNQMPYFTSINMQGVGGLSSSASDLINFIKLQLGTTDRAVALTHTRSFNAGYYDIGLSWYSYKFDNGNHQLWVDGGTYGFASYVIFYPEINSGVVVLSNESDETTPGKISDIADLLFNFMQKNKPGTK